MVLLSVSIIREPHLQELEMTFQIRVVLMQLVDLARKPHQMQAGIWKQISNINGYLHNSEHYFFPMDIYRKTFSSMILLYTIKIIISLYKERGMALIIMNDP